MTDAPKPPPPGAGAPKPHEHDLRVDPSHLITNVGGELRIRVVCAEISCRKVGFIYSKPKRAVRTDNPTTWRRYHYEPGDAVRLEGTGKTAHHNGPRS